jgi:TonB-dependent receptor
VKTNYFLGLAVASALTLSYAPLAAQEEAVDEIVTEEEAVDEREAMEEIVAVGIRGSLQAAADIKRNDSRIVDAVVAEDIGKLPDNNIAEALQRVTGVSLARDFGIGEGVSIRGMSQNRIEINGRTTSGDDRDGVSLDDIPSSFLSSVEVIKSPTADMIEGALGGTVRMNTFRPLDLDGRRLAGSLDYEYADKTEEWNPIVNATYGDVWDLDNGGAFGVVANLSYMDRTIRRDVTHGRNEMFDAADNLGFSSNGPSDLFMIRNQNTLEQDLENRERTSLNLSMQWAPASDDGSVYLDVTMADRSGWNQSNSILEVGGLNNLPVGDPGSSFTSDTYQTRYGVLENTRLNDTFAIPKAQVDFRETETFSSALGFDFDLSDKLNVSGEISYSSSATVGPGSNFDMRPLNQANWDSWIASFADADEFNEAFDQDGVNDRLDSDGDPISFNNAFDDDCRPNYGCRNTFDALQFQSGDHAPGVDFLGSDAQSSGTNLAVRAFGYNEEIIDNEELAARLDMDLAEPFGWESVSSLKAGVRFTENTFDYNELEWATGSSTYRRAFDADTGMPVVTFADEWEAMFPGSFTLFSHPNTFSQHGLSGTYDLGQYYIYEDLSNSQKVWEQFQQLYGNTTAYGAAGTLRENMELDQNSFRDITESTGALYVSAELDFDRISAVVGARYTTTDIDSTTFVDGSLVSGSNSYSDTLPSLNLTFAVTDQTQVRFAAAKVMRRPNYEYLSSAFEINGNIVTGERGALDLEPYRATQYDLSVEHYFEDGGLVSFALFYKDIASFLQDTTTCVAHPLTTGNPPQNVTEWKDVCLLSTPGVSTDQLNYADSTLDDVTGFDLLRDLRDAGLTGIETNQLSNGKDGKVEGFELAYQQHFDFLPGAWGGFGVAVNYTRADSETPSGNPLEDLSENTYNAQVYWEGDTFQARLAYNYRDEYLDSVNEKRISSIGKLGLGQTGSDDTAGNNYRDARGQLDFSAAWDATDNITVVANVVNLTEEPITQITELGGPWQWRESDRRISFGVRANFE